jgi:hypothetical protein
VETGIREVITVAAAVGQGLQFMIANLNVLPSAEKGTLATGDSGHPGGGCPWNFRVRQRHRLFRR